jgi:hypothetical protein
VIEGVQTLTVRPLEVGWGLEVPGADGEMVFATGAAAEAAARRLAARMAAAGQPVKLVVRLKDGSIGGRFLFPPAMTPTTLEAA